MFGVPRTVLIQRRIELKRAKPPTARQKRWHDYLAKYGCGMTRRPAEIHHCVGSAGMHNKIHIGQDFCIPLSPDHHKSLHGDRSLFDGRRRKEIEKEIFERVYTLACVEIPEDIPPIEVVRAIRDYHR